MATSITTLSGRRCTVVPRTQFFTTVSTSAATDLAGLPGILSSFTTSTIPDTSSTSLTSTIAQPTDSSPASAITSLATTVVAASNTITAAAATLSPLITSSSTPLPSTQSPDNTGDPTGHTSKKNVIAAAVGASLGAVAVVALVFLCAYFRRRKRRTSAQTKDTEKRPGTTARFPRVAQLLDRFNPRAVAALVPAIVDKVRPVFTNLRSLPFISGSRRNDRPEQTQSGPTKRGFSVSRPIPQENSMQGAGMPSAPRAIQESSNPFADPPTANIGTSRNNNNRPENPFADPADPFSHIDYGDNISFSLPLTIRNGVTDDGDDIDVNTNGANKRDRQSARSILSGSTLNIPNNRASSPLVHEFYSTWKSSDRKSMKAEDRSSTYSDPFDLERLPTRPPTMHSSAHPTPMEEQQRSQRVDYFSDLNFDFSRALS